MASLIYVPIVSAESTDPLSEYQLSVKFGGWSKHVDEKNVGGKKWNENHMGYGLKYSQKKTDSLNFVIEGWRMKDSYFDPSTYLGAGVSYDFPINSENFGISFTVTGGFLNRNLHFYDEFSDKIYIEKKTSMIPMYYATIELFEKAELDFLYIPKGYGQVSNEVYFMRFGYKF